MTAHRGLLDHREVRIFVAGRRVRDLADGTYFTCQQTADDAIVEEGVNAAAVVIKTGAGLWEATITLLASSVFNRFFDALRNAWINTPGGIPISFGITHKQTDLVAASAIIRRPPPVAYARTSAPPRDWQFFLMGMTGVIGGFELDTEVPIPQSVFDVLNP